MLFWSLPFGSKPKHDMAIFGLIPLHLNVVLHNNRRDSSILFGALLKAKKQLFNSTFNNCELYTMIQPFQQVSIYKKRRNYALAVWGHLSRIRHPIDAHATPTIAKKVGSSSFLYIFVSYLALMDTVTVQTFLMSQLSQTSILKCQVGTLQKISSSNRLAPS